MSRVLSNVKAGSQAKVGEVAQWNEGHLLVCDSWDRRKEEGEIAPVRACRLEGYFGRVTG